jgi:hypothetical protein
MNPREIEKLTEEGKKLAEPLYKINCKLVRNMAPPVELKRVPKYVQPPEEVEAACKKVLKEKGLTIAGLIRALNFETGGKFSEAKLKGFIETLEGDELVTIGEPTPGEGTKRIVTLTK